MKDITKRFRDLNDWDRVYLSDSGYTVKIKTSQRRPSPEVTVLEVSGSLCDDKTAKALPEGPGHFIVRPHEVTIMSDQPSDMAKLLEEGHALIVRRVEQAAINRAALEALVGVRAPLAPPGS